MDKKTANLLYNLSKTLFENDSIEATNAEYWPQRSAREEYFSPEYQQKVDRHIEMNAPGAAQAASAFQQKQSTPTDDGFDPTGGTSEYAKGNPDVQKRLTEWGNKTKDWFSQQWDKVNPWNPVNVRDSADAANEEDMERYNQKLRKEQELADIRARDEADASNQEGMNNSQHQTPVQQPVTQQQNNQSVKPTTPNLPHDNGSSNNNENMSGGVLDSLKSAAGDAGNWISQNPGLATAAVGVPLALAGSYLAYKKMKNKNNNQTN